MLVLSTVFAGQCSVLCCLYLYQRGDTGKVRIPALSWTFGTALQVWPSFCRALPLSAYSVQQMVTDQNFNSSAERSLQWRLWPPLPSPLHGDTEQKWHRTVKILFFKILSKLCKELFMPWALKGSRAQNQTVITSSYPCFCFLILPEIKPSFTMNIPYLWLKLPEGLNKYLGFF